MANYRGHFLYIFYFSVLLVAASGDLSPSCKDDAVKSKCESKCGKFNWHCHGTSCHCIKINEDDGEIDIHGIYNKKNALRAPQYDFVESTELADRAILRHHIAHFCPNLEDARQCIRQCTKVGKPAFCGKDHVCYCGHRYSSNDMAKPMNMKDMYAQYRDLYTKYFGPQSGERLQLKKEGITLVHKIITDDESKKHTTEDEGKEDKEKEELEDKSNEEKHESDEESGTEEEESISYELLEDNIIYREPHENKENSKEEEHLDDEEHENEEETEEEGHVDDEEHEKEEETTDEHNDGNENEHTE